MAASWVIVLSGLYLVGLVALAWWGDRRGAGLIAGRARGTVHALALGVYCTSWTFFGSVGLAPSTGLDYLAVYLGPVLVFAAGRPLIARIVRIAKAQNTTSVADFVGARYGKSEGVAALICLVAVVGAVPYIALQLRAVTASLRVLLAFAGAGRVDRGAVALGVALVLAGFACAFGTRRAEAVEHRNGLMLAVAAGSVVKLAAFLAVGAAVAAWTLGEGPGAPGLDEVRAAALAVVGRTSEPAYFISLALIAGAAALLLPRQFHVAVVEAQGPGDAARAAWALPLYLAPFALLVVPLAATALALAGGGGTGLGAPPDMAAIALPLLAGAEGVAFLAFLGGLSAAAGMIVVESVAMAVMVSNHLVIPLVLRRRGLAHPEAAGASPDLGRLLLVIRRAAVAGTILVAYVYERAGGGALAVMGLLSFAAVAQVAPAFLCGLFWARGTARGAMAGLVAGLLVWVYTLLLPNLASAGGVLADLVAEGPFGIAALRPTALFGTALPPLTHGALWSLALNLAVFVTVSLARRPTARERAQAEAFLDHGTGPARRPRRAGPGADELEAMVARFLGPERTRAAFTAFISGRATPRSRVWGGADPALARFAETLLASAIGASSSRLAIRLLPRRGRVGRGEALALLDDAAALHRDRDLLQHALDHAGQGIAVFDEARRLTAWNQAFLDLCGTLPGEGDPVGRLDGLARPVAEPGSAPDEPRRLPLPDGRTLEVRTNPLPEGGSVATYTDITERVGVEEARERLNELLERRVRERTEALARAKAEADEANLSKTRFLAAASHDILQPLNAARLYAAALVERDREAGRAGLAENVDASLDAVEEILTTLLDISRLDAGALRPRWAPVPLDGLLAQIRREFEPAAAAKGLGLTVLPCALAVRSDRQLLSRLLQNLVSNAVKYTGEGRVLVGVRRRGARLSLEVWDTGMGIPAAKQALVFREFERLEGARAARGLGLGLSIVERLARVLDHPVSLASEPGRGSVFRVSLPRAHDTAEPGEAPRSRPAAPFAGFRVLAIDNEPAILDAMRLLLEGWGCTVATAASLAEALAGAPPDVVLADYHLDGASGLDAVRALRREHGLLPAALVTADRSPSLREAAEGEGVQVLTKPLKPASLRALLARWRAGTSPESWAAE